VVIEETATTGAALLFGVLAVFVLLAFRNLAGIVVAGCFASLSIYSAVRSSYIADRDQRVLIIERKLARWTVTKVYKSALIDGEYVRFTIRGSGLALKFKSGRSKDLTLSLGSTAGLERAAGALNHFL
jgi:hypothetical protein